MENETFGPSRHDSLAKSLWRQVSRPVAMFMIVFSFGTLGYRLIALHQGREHDIWDCFYQVGILLPGVGFTDHLESHDSVPGIIFTVIMSFFGLGFLLWLMSTVTAFIVSGELSQVLGRQRMARRIAELREHYVICGTGETGRHCVQELLDTNRPFVVVELDPERLEALQKITGPVLHLLADASEDTVLEEAGIDKAQGLISSLPNDKDNLLVTISARQLNPRLRIISRCVELDNAKKLRKAGADSVVCPNMIGGLRMVSEMIRPSVVTFLDVMLRDSRKIRIEEARVPKESAYVGQTLAEAKLTEKAEVNIIATRDPGAGDFTYNPRGSTRLQAGTELVLIGSAEAVASFREDLRKS